MYRVKSAFPPFVRFLSVCRGTESIPSSFSESRSGRLRRRLAAGTAFLVAGAPLPLVAQQPAFQAPQATVQGPQTVSGPQSVIVSDADTRTSSPVMPISSQPSIPPSAAITGSAAESATAAPQAGPPPFEVYTDYNWGNAMAKRLRNAPAKLYNFDRASLRDVLRFLADDAGIPFVAMQESSAVEGTLVTFTLRASPFFALETIARANGVALFYENGIWFMRPINEKELVARIYKLKYNPQDNITYTGGQANSSGSGGSGGSGGDGGISGLDLTLQQPTSVFQIKAPEMIEQIRKLLGIPSTGLSGSMAGEAGVGEFGTMQVPQSVNPAGSNFLPASATAGEGGAQAVYNTDSNTIYVLATMQQHKWVEGFLSAVDRPQSLIAIEIKFLETSRDPSKELGIDWSETLEGGYGITAGAEAFAEGGLDTNSVATSLDSFGRTIVNQNLNGVNTTDTLSTRRTSVNEGPNTLGDPGNSRRTTFSGGYAAVLSPEDVTVRLNAFVRDKDTSVVQYPRVLTINNREVAIRSVVNQPVLASTASVDTTGGTGTTAASVEYLPIGTIINVLPKLMPDNSVILNVAITISRIVGFENIVLQPGQVQPYPVAASRVYTAALQVNSGYTLAVSGLDESTDGSNDSGIPYLKDVPGLGYLFKSKKRDQVKKNLIIFITPTVFGDRAQTEGITTSPDTIVPKRPDDASPPAFTSKGRLVGGAAAVEEALQWLERQVRIFKQMKKEGLSDKETQKQLKGVIDSANLLVKEIQLLEEQNPAILQTLVDQEGRALKFVSDLNRVYSESRNKIESFGATP